MTSLLTFEQAAERLAVRESWLRKAVAAGAAPHTRIGRHVRFTEQNLTDLVEAGQRRPTPVRPVRGRRSA